MKKCMRTAYLSLILSLLLSFFFGFGGRANAGLSPGIYPISGTDLIVDYTDDTINIYDDGVLYHTVTDSDLGGELPYFGLTKTYGRTNDMWNGITIGYTDGSTFGGVSYTLDTGATAFKNCYIFSPVIKGYSNKFQGYDVNSDYIKCVNGGSSVNSQCKNNAWTNIFGAASEGYECFGTSYPVVHNLTTDGDYINIDISGPSAPENPELEVENLTCETYTVSESTFEVYSGEFNEEGYNEESDIYYVTSESGALAWLGGVKNVNNFLTGSTDVLEGVEFNAKNTFLGFGEKPNLYLYDGRGIDLIKLAGENINISKIELYNSNGVLVRSINGDNVLIGGEYLYGTYTSAKVFFSKTIQDMSISDIFFGGQNILEVEKQYCINDDTGEATLDGEEFIGIPDGLDTTDNTMLDPNDWSFLVSGYSFFENGFALHEFIPTPNGGELFFEIVNPLGVKEITKAYKNYGVSSTVKVTYPYHTIAGNYKVRILYKYGGVSANITGESYNNYTITLPERPGVSDDLTGWDIQACNDGNESAGFLPGVSNFFLCLTSSIKNIFVGIGEFFTNIKQFFDSFGGIVTDEVKTFSFIGSANATQYIGIMPKAGEDFYATPIGKITRVFNSFAVIFFLVVGLVIFIKLNTYRKGGK